MPNFRSGIASSDFFYGDDVCVSIGSNLVCHFKIRRHIRYPLSYHRDVFLSDNIMIPKHVATSFKADATGLPFSIIQFDILPLLLQLTINVNVRLWQT